MTKPPCVYAYFVLDDWPFEMSDLVNVTAFAGPLIPTILTHSFYCYSWLVACCLEIQKFKFVIHYRIPSQWGSLAPEARYSPDR
jgi:hypothetical protein